jgi:hypothetical protein
MPHWTLEKNKYFVDVIHDYRNNIANKSKKETDKVTWDLAMKLRNNFTLLKEHSEQAVYEHLSYMDDLLAGIPNISYAKKDDVYYGKIPRTFNTDKLNLSRVMRSSTK